MSSLQEEPHTRGARLAVVRNEHGLTRWHVAQLLGLETHHVEAYEHGQPVPFPILTTFCEVFTVQGTWLLRGTGQHYGYEGPVYPADTLFL